MSSEKLVCTIEVMLNGHRHQVIVSGKNSPVFGFESTEGQTFEPIPLRFRCDVCDGTAKLAFLPPSATWRRPYVVRRVVHTTDE
jgi:hypothetical protein